jgi:hypothetical protein
VNLPAPSLQANTMTTTAPITFGSADNSEELARAELYGLLAQLWLAPPDEDLLQQFRVAVTEAPQQGGWLEAPWHDLVAALRATTVDKAAAEHTALFLSVGKPEVFAYASLPPHGFPERKAAGHACATTWPRWACRANRRHWKPKTTSPICWR